MAGVVPILLVSATVVFISGLGVGGKVWTYIPKQSMIKMSPPTTYGNILKHSCYNIVGDIGKHIHEH